MKTIVKPLLAVFLLVFLASGQTPLHAAEPAQSSVDWQTWTDDVFNVAVAEQRYVILNLEAVWCHWCHVMDAETYSDAKVSELIEKHYLPVRVDHDARPDLAQRYRNYGWPATIVFAPDGTEIVKRAGYIAPDNFARLLQAIVDNPSPEAVAKLTPPTQFSDRAFLSESLKEKLLAALRGKIKTVLIPQQNEKDLEELPKEVKDNLTIKTARGRAGEGDPREHLRRHRAL